jgi:hypothetical protein
MRLPWLHPHRADVLAAIALVVRQREPLALGLARLAEGDPLLRPWSARLGPDLAAGAALPEVLWRHRLIDHHAAERLIEVPDPVAACDRLAVESLTPVRGLLLIRWFPVALAAVMLGPVALLSTSGVLGDFEQIFLDLNIHLPAITVLVIEASYVGLLLPLVGGLAMLCLMSLLHQVRGVRHITHLWWVEVHRQAAMLELVEAAIAGDDEPQHYDMPVSWGIEVRLSALRQDRPAWDLGWRTWRILTRFRALGHNWREAARASTAAGVLQALGLLPVAPEASSLEALRASVRQRLIHALEPAQAEARALLTIAFALGLFIAVLAVFLPLISIVVQLN